MVFYRTPSHSLDASDINKSWLQAQLLANEGSDRSSTAAATTTTETNNDTWLPTNVWNWFVTSEHHDDDGSFDGIIREIKPPAVPLPYYEAEPGSAYLEEDLHDLSCSSNSSDLASGVWRQPDSWTPLAPQAKGFQQQHGVSPSCSRLYFDDNEPSSRSCSNSSTVSDDDATKVLFWQRAVRQGRHVPPWRNRPGTKLTPVAELPAAHAGPLASLSPLVTPDDDVPVSPLMTPDDDVPVITDPATLPALDDDVVSDQETKSTSSLSASSSNVSPSRSGRSSKSSYRAARHRTSRPIAVQRTLDQRHQQKARAVAAATAAANVAAPPMPVLERKDDSLRAHTTSMDPAKRNFHPDAALPLASSVHSVLPDDDDVLGVSARSPTPVASNVMPTFNAWITDDEPSSQLAHKISATLTQRVENEALISPPPRCHPDDNDAPSITTRSTHFIMRSRPQWKVGLVPWRRPQLWCHPVACMALCCPLILLGQVLTRLGLSPCMHRLSAGRRDNVNATVIMALLLLAFVVFDNMLSAVCIPKLNSAAVYTGADGSTLKDYDNIPLWVLVALAVRAATRGLMVMYGVLTTIRLRHYVRTQHQLPRQVCAEDVWVGALCCCCTLAQMAHQTTPDANRAVICTATGLQSTNSPPSVVKMRCRDNGGGGYDSSRHSLTKASVTEQLDEFTASRRNLETTSRWSSSQRSLISI